MSKSNVIQTERNSQSIYFSIVWKYCFIFPWTWLKLNSLFETLFMRIQFSLLMGWVHVVSLELNLVQTLFCDVYMHCKSVCVQAALVLYCLLASHKWLQALSDHRSLDMQYQLSMQSSPDHKFCIWHLIFTFQFDCLVVIRKCEPGICMLQNKCWNVVSR